ncbi:MAG: AMMECR1 domain-containing protein [Acidobacteria bacterium]|nr:MAG: AMMECR1 domain-containing protein [Acidobacteriota bacterium]
MSTHDEYSAEERSLLLKLAHRSIESALEDRTISWDCPTAHLAEPRGVFTTLYRQGQLRGCVGYVFPVAPLYGAVIETARAAASQDTRFAPVTREEAPELAISLSVLSRLQPILPEQIEIGRHGLVVSLGSHRGLLLPQVPVEHHWDRETFLAQTCRKAGLPARAWETGATLEAFTAEVFGDDEQGG